MTIIEEQQAAVFPVAQFPVKETDPSVLDTLAAAFRLENSVASTLASGQQGEALDGYDPFDDIEGFEPHADRFIESISPEDTQRIKQNIVRELQDREVLHDAGGFGVAAAIGAGALDPMFLPAMLIPGGAIVKGERVSTVAFKSVQAGALGGAIAEFPLQMTQEIRSGQETAIAIGASALLSGIFGTGIGVFARRDISKAEAAITADVRDIVTGESVGAALARNTTLEQEKMVGSLGMAEALKQTNPLLRTSQSPAKSTRQVVQDLVENGFFTQKNLEGIRTPAAVETFVKQHDARLSAAVETLDMQFVKYRTAAVGGRAQRMKLSVQDLIQNTDKLSFADFKREVSYALRRNDKHAIPEVAATAGHYRKTVFDPLKERAIALGLLSEGVGETTETVSKNINVKQTTIDNLVLKDGIVDEAQTLKSLPPLAEGNVRLFRAESPTIGFKDIFKADKLKEFAPPAGKTGKHFTSEIKFADFFRESFGRDAKIRFIDLPDSAAKKLEVRPGEFFVDIKKPIRTTETITKPGSIVGADSYLTRIYRWPKIRAERAKFTGILVDWFEKRHGLDNDMARQVAEEVIENIRHAPAGHIQKDIVPKAGPLKSRVLDVPDEFIEEFLEDDIEVIASHYVHTMAPEVEIVERFGSKDMTAQISAISDEYGALIAKADTPKLRTRLANQMEQDLKDVQAMRDRLIGTYGQPNDPSSFIVRAGRTVRDYNFLRLLGGMTVSAAPDVARPIMRHGLRPYAKAARQLATAPERTKLLKRELKAMGVGLDMTLNSRAKAIAEIGEVSQFSGTVGRVGRNLSTNYGVVTLMSPWNAAWKQFSGIMASNEIIHQSGRLVRGTIGKKDIAKLAQSGIDADLARRITTQIKKHGDVGDVTLPQAHLWDDAEAAQVFSAAILKDVELSIVTPGIGDRPLWVSSEMGKIAGQFKSFQFASTNRVMIAGLQIRDAAALNGMLLSVALGSLVYGAKQKLGGREISTDPVIVLTEAIDRSGMTGIIFDVNNITEKFTRGRLGISSLTGGPTMSRYQSRNVMGALFGPTADAIPDLAQVGGAISTGEITDSDIHTARKLVPYQNLFYTRWLFDQAEKGVANEVGTN